VRPAVYSATVSRTARALLFATFAATGFSALTLQVVWQRVLSLHAGIDLIAATTVVTAFMAGLGIGSLAGGALADRLGPRGSLLAFALANVGIGAFAWASLWLFYDVYRQHAAALDSAAAMFGFHFLLLAVPTTLMGLSLPLLARGVVARAGEIGALVGRLYAVNTLGAAAGAAVAGWVLLGELGFVGTVRVAAGLNFAAAAVVAALWYLLRPAAAGAGTPASTVAAGSSSAVSPSPGAGEPPPAEARVWPWLLLYAVTGAVAIALEVVYFRVVDAILRNNSYTFATVLALYLLLFASGAALGSRRASRVARPDRWFLFLQLGVGLATLLGMLVLLHPPDAFGIAAAVTRYYQSGGFMHGGYSLATLAEAARLLYAHAVAPLLVMGLPVLLMGASFPFVQAVVARRLDSLGRRTGALLFANICGNVGGGAAAGFVLLDRLGTAGTLQLLAGVLLLPGFVAVAGLPTWRHRVATGLAILLVFGASLAAFPGNERFWAFFHGATVDRFELAEDRACVTSLVHEGEQSFLHINGSWQNGHPYDLFHILIGLLPSLMHEDPKNGLAIGLGIGSTAYAMAQDSRIDHVDCVEICGGQEPLIATLGERGSTSSQRLLADPRVHLATADGRRWLLTRPDLYDVVVVDVVRPNTAYSGNLYSVEFYELVKSRLAPGGVFVQWVPTDRVLNAVRRVFPHVALGAVPDYFDSRFVVASNERMTLHTPLLRERLERRVDMAASFDAEQQRRLRAYFTDSTLQRLFERAKIAALPEEQLNRDLRPRDEYFLNDTW
jgi:spermidine synthase